MYLLIDTEGRVKGTALTPEGAWEKVYEEGIGNIVVPMDRVTVNIDLSTQKLPRFKFPREYDILKNVLASSTYTRVSVPDQQVFDVWYDLKIEPLITVGKKIMAIKEAREFTSLGLGEAKAFIDQSWALPIS